MAKEPVVRIEALEDDLKKLKRVLSVRDRELRALQRKTDEQSKRLTVLQSQLTSLSTSFSRLNR